MSSPRIVITSSDGGMELWEDRQAGQVNALEVSLHREQQAVRSEASCLQSLENRRRRFVEEYEWEDQDAPLVIQTAETLDLRHWCREQSWSYYGECGKMSRRKLLPSFRRRNIPALETGCKCGAGVYAMPSLDDVPLLLRGLTEADVRVLRPLDIRCGKYRQMVHGYRQRTGPFRVTWSALSVCEKLDAVVDKHRRRKLVRVFDWLMANPASSYRKFVVMQSRGVAQPMLLQIFSAPKFRGIECALWPTLYRTPTMCESIMEGQSNRATGKQSFMNKVLSSVVDYSLSFELLQYQYDRWLFKTITGAVNSSRASGCSPNVGLQHKSFSATYWRWQHLYLLDAVRQYGYPSFFVTVSPYEWTFPWPTFVEELHHDQGLQPTELPVLETIHVAHTLEKIARGFLTGANCNRWRQHLFGDTVNPANRNVLTYFYRFEFQERDTLHLHMLVWVKDVSVVRADLLQASIPWQNQSDAFLVADVQKSDRSSLAVNESPCNSFVQKPDGTTQLEFRYTAEDTHRNIRAFVTTLLGSMRCRTNVQVADGKEMLLKYVTSYVMKMHDASTSKGLYCLDISGFQVANSFLWMVHPLVPEMVFQLSTIKVAWTDKMTKQFRPPYPG